MYLFNNFKLLFRSYDTDIHIYCMYAYCLNLFCYVTLRCVYVVIIIIIVGYLNQPERFKHYVFAAIIGLCSDSHQSPVMVMHDCTRTPLCLTQLAKYVTAPETLPMAAGQPGCGFYFLVGKFTFLLLIFTPVSILGESITKPPVLHLGYMEMLYC